LTAGTLFVSTLIIDWENPRPPDFFSKYPDMGFLGPWGKNPYSHQIIGAALSCHRLTQCTKPPIFGKDNVLHATDSDFENGAPF
jgi:hypothetical protein